MCVTMCKRFGPLRLNTVIGLVALFVVAIQVSTTRIPWFFDSMSIWWYYCFQTIHVNHARNFIPRQP